MIQSKDTVGYFKRNMCKIVTCADSIGCTSCKLRLPAWKEFINVVDSLCQDSVQFLFISKLRDICRQRLFLCMVSE